MNHWTKRRVQIFAKMHMRCREKKKNGKMRRSIKSRNEFGMQILHAHARSRPHANFVRNFPNNHESQPTMENVHFPYVTRVQITTLMKRPIATLKWKKKKFFVFVSVNNESGWLLYNTRQVIRWLLLLRPSCLCYKQPFVSGGKPATERFTQHPSHLYTFCIRVCWCVCVCVLVCAFVRFNTLQLLFLFFLIKNNKEMLKCWNWFVGWFFFTINLLVWLLI